MMVVGTVIALASFYDVFLTPDFDFGVTSRP